MSTTPCWPRSGTIAGPLHGGASQLAYSLLVDAERDGVERALDDTLRWQRRPARLRPHGLQARRRPLHRAPRGCSSSWPPPEQVELVAVAHRAGRRPLHPAPQRRPGHGRHRLVDGDGGRCRADPVHRGPGGRLGGPLSRGAGRATAPLPGPRRLRHAGPDGRRSRHPHRPRPVGPPLGDLRSVHGPSRPQPRPHLPGDRSLVRHRRRDRPPARRPGPRGHTGGPQPGEAARPWPTS